MNDFFINHNNFDENFKKILKQKKGKNIIRTRFYLEHSTIKFKINFLINYLNTISGFIAITYKILFWESDNKIINFLEENVSDYNILSGYLNNKKPGIVYISHKTIDLKFLESILINHFNYEKAKEPSINIRLQFAIETDIQIILFDIYDDRGLDAYFIEKNISKR
jgi:hypothetical protein